MTKSIEKGKAIAAIDVTKKDIVIEGHWTPVG